ncbi:hypothetical protein [Cellulomonas sp. URHD0024]|uniref:hypothetical protein n=1 Tax=Cellulomonas sp. URHD0024 TaxID=1302620 RepID=UPI0004239E35|nr:hypothetical protein [Cellulomonas sp. URHD0024]
MTIELRTGDGTVVGVVDHVAELVLPDGRTEPFRDAGTDADGTRRGTCRGFRAEARWSPSDGSGARRVRLTVRYDGARPADASIRVRCSLPPHDDPPWWLVPGSFYGANRPSDSTVVFPRFEVGSRDYDHLVSDHWALRADRAATPAVFGWAGPGGLAMLAAETTSLGMTGLGFAHDARTRRGSLHLTFPFREEPVSYDGSPSPRPAEVATHRWAPGEEVCVELVVHALGSDRHGYASVLRDEHARSRASSPLRPWVAIPEAADLAADGLCRWHYAEPGVLLETVGFDRGIAGRDGLSVDRQAMHVGWLSGIPWAYALLVHGRRRARPEEVRRAERVIDFVCADLSPSGSFWGVWYAEGGWTQSWSSRPHALQSRTLAEASLFLLRALELGPEVRSEHPRWSEALRSTLDAVAARQRADGNLGAAHDALTGEVLSWDSTAGLAWVAPLAEASRWDDGSYLAAAEHAGDYYAPFVEGGLLHGAPEDVDAAPTSEDGYVAVMSYMALHRRTGDPRWLDLARRAADWMLTFRYTYNTAFPSGTLLDVYDFRTRGADNASPPNPHLHAYGLVCTAELAELSVATGDDHYVERARETLACFRQLIARFDGDFNAYRGMASERYYQTESFQPKGMLLTLSHAWSVGVLLLACEQAIVRPELLVPAR